MDGDRTPRAGSSASDFSLTTPERQGQHTASTITPSTQHSGSSVTRVKNLNVDSPLGLTNKSTGSNHIAMPGLGNNQVGSTELGYNAALAVGGAGPSASGYWEVPLPPNVPVTSMFPSLESVLGQATLSPEANAFTPHKVDFYSGTYSMKDDEGWRKTPSADLISRRHGGDVFAQNKYGEVLTCFVLARGHDISLWSVKGPYFRIRNFASFAGIHTGARPDDVYMTFMDVRDADATIEMIYSMADGLNRHHGRVLVFCVSAAQFWSTGRYTLSGPHSMLELDPTFRTGFDGQVLVKAVYTDALCRINSVKDMNIRLAGVVGCYVRAWGEPKAMKQIACYPNKRTVVWHVEMCQHTLATKMDEYSKAYPSGWPCYGVHLWVVQYTPQCAFPEVNLRTAARDHRDGPKLDKFGCRLLTEVLRLRNEFRAQAAIADKACNEYNEDHRISQIGLPLPVSPSRDDEKNVVHLNRISAGVDVRTTIMLRNIPNRVNQPILKEVVDSVSFGRYDFMYLRIDFNNGCNVGYAFINFIRAEDIIPFYMEISGNRWKNSDKIAQISYATVQGRDCLIQKFRNSIVMQEPSESRPKLFYTLGHPLAGQEERFPRADNYFKLARSEQNAATIGLFTPSRRDHDHMPRRRRGQYDRGTSFAKMEELAVDNQMFRTLNGLHLNGGIPDDDY